MRSLEEMSDGWTRSLGSVGIVKRNCDTLIRCAWYCGFRVAAKIVIGDIVIIRML